MAYKGEINIKSEYSMPFMINLVDVHVCIEKQLVDFVFFSCKIRHASTSANKYIARFALFWFSI